MFNASHVQKVRSTVAFFLTSCFLICLNLPGKAQVPANQIGLNPTSLKWNQINTDKVQVIFPKGLESQGQRVANLAHYLWDEHDASVGDLDGKVSILLQNQTAISNGFVTVGPFRSEFYMTPPQFDVTTDWLDILTIHEYRHVKQFMNTRKGITNLARNVLGSWAWGGLFATALPRWYFEGDATGMETVLTASGRGRFPAFNMEYRSLVLEGKKFGYEKAGAGSLKEFVPSWYPLGYYMTSYARKNFGEDIWSKVVSDAVQYKGLFYPFSKSLKKHSGHTTKTLYKAMRSELDSLWENQVMPRSELVQGKPINDLNKKTFTQYTNPLFLPNGNLILRKAAFNQLPTYYEIDKRGNERKVVETGLLLDQEMGTLSYANNKLCWAELAFHPRWRNKTYSIIRVYNQATKKKFKITSQSRYFSPALSPNGHQIVAISVSENLENRIVILNADTGERIQTLSNPENILYIHPQWTNDGSAIVAIAKQNETHSLVRIDVSTGASEVLLPPTYSALSHPYIHDQTIFFSAGFGLVNNIYALKMGTSQIYQVTDSRLGAFQPSVSPNGEELAFADFTSEGYNVILAEIDEAKWVTITLSNQPIDPNYVGILAQQEAGKSILSSVPDNQFEVKKFNKWSGIINPHSILPNLTPPIAEVAILSDNKFSTLSAQAAASYNYNEDEWTFSGDLTYAELFPILYLDFRRSNRSTNFFNFDRIQDTSIVSTFFTEEWAENDLSAGVSVPLNFSQGLQSSQLDLYGEFHLINTFSENRFDLPSNFRDTINGDARGIDNLAAFEAPVLRDEKFSAMEIGFRFFSLKRLAAQHLRSRLGVVLSGSYRSLLNSGAFNGDVLLLRGDLYLPGLGKNHSLLVNTLYQKSAVLDNYQFANRFFYPRGHSRPTSDDVFKVGVNYAIPLIYPDLPLGSLAFLKRIKANLFYDYANLITGSPFSPESTFNSQISSVGVELTFDARFFRLLEIDFGVRYSYLVDTLFDGQERNQFDFLLISISQ